MLPFLRKQRSLYVWALTALTETAVAIPWMIFSYSILNYKDWPPNLPGAWLPLVIITAASLWEAGDRSEAGQAGSRRILATTAGMAGSYVLAYFGMPGALRTGLIGANPAWAILPVAGYLWYQGVFTVAGGLDYSRLYSRYPWQVGAALAGSILLIISGGAADSRVMVLLYWSVLLLFAAGLSGLVVAREVALRAGQARLGETQQGGGRLYPIMTWLILSLLGLTLIASRLMSVERLAYVTALVGGWIGTAWSWVLSVVNLILYRWAMVAAILIEPLWRWLLSLRNEEPQRAQPGEIDWGEFREHEPLIPTDVLLPYIQAALVVAAICALAWFVYKISVKPKARAAADEEERESLGFWANLLDDLKGLTKGAAGAAKPLSAVETLSPRDPRMLYRRLQAWGAVIGRPRLSAETPSVYSRELTARHPDRQEPVAAVTAVYIQARYGATPPLAEQVDQAYGAVEALERELRGEK